MDWIEYRLSRLESLTTDLQRQIRRLKRQLYAVSILAGLSAILATLLAARLFWHLRP
jgi:hypothetical protein